MNYSIPGPKAPPKHMQQAAKAERARRKACHGSWVECSPRCSNAHPATP